MIIMQTIQFYYYTEGEEREETYALLGPMGWDGAT